MCGSSSIDICSGNTFNLGLEGFVPANTICQYDLVCSTTFSIDLRLERNDAVQLVVRASINGTSVVITPTSRRSLDSRRALTTTETYSIQGADSAEIISINSEAYNSTVMTTDVCPANENSESNSFDN